MNVRVGVVNEVIGRVLAETKKRRELNPAAV
jgi:hypothetical protein